MIITMIRMMKEKEQYKKVHVFGTGAVLVIAGKKNLSVKEEWDDEEKNKKKRRSKNWISHCVS